MEPSVEQSAIRDFVRNSAESLSIDAKAGTGKTTTLIHYVLPELEGATWLCAFNKAISLEIEAKCRAKGISEDTVRISTVHAGGMRVWNKHLSPRKVKVESRKVRNIVDELAEKDETYVKYGNVICRLVEYAKSAGFGVLARISSHDNWYELIEHFGINVESEDDDFDWYPVISAAIKVYQKSLALCEKVVDFSDMLLAPLYHKAKFPKYRNILIDEAQDISPLRLKLITSCLASDGRIIAVGDPNQAIYGFTGADDKSMETIKDYSGAVELPLTVTYRCPKAVVEVAQQWVPRITAHPSAPEGKVINAVLRADPTGAVQSLCFWDFGPFSADDVVLCRNTKPLVELAYQFLRKRLPCRIEGRDIGQGLIRIIERWKKGKNRVETLQQLSVVLEEWKNTEVAKFTDMKQEYKAENIADQCDTVQVLIDACAEDGGTSPADVINLINRMFEDTTEGEKPKCLTMSTVHKSKGREWPRVFLLGRNRYMPSKFARQQWEKEQEVNLMYVAVTRAQKELIEVSVPLK